MKKLLILLSVVILSLSYAQECEAGFRLFDHALGTTCVPENPERIVAVGSSAMEALLALNVVPAGFATWTASGNTPGVPEYIGDRFDLSASRFLGGEDEPSLEGIVALNPELIISESSMTDLYTPLSEIAPTVALTGWDADEERATWQDFLCETGSVVGRSAEAETVLDTYVKRTEVLKATLEDQASTTVSLVRFMPSEVRAYLKGSYAGTIMQDAGISRPEAQNKAGFVETVSLESVQLADGDVILVAQSDPDGVLFDQFSASPLWQTLEGVQRDQVVQVDHEIWIGGSSIIAAHAVLTDLFRYVAGVDPQEVSPNPFQPE